MENHGTLKLTGLLFDIEKDKNGVLEMIAEEGRLLHELVREVHELHFNSLTDSEDGRGLQATLEDYYLRGAAAAVAAFSKKADGPDTPMTIRRGIVDELSRYATDQIDRIEALDELYEETDNG